MCGRVVVRWRALCARHPRPRTRLRNARMSTDGTVPTDPTTPPTVAPEGAPLQAPAVPEGFTSAGEQGVPQQENEPGFVTRHTTTLITLMVAVIVAAVAIAGVSIYRHNVDQKNSKTEA